MGRLGGGEILLILVIALLVFGPSKLADMGKGLGEGLKNFKKGISGGDDSDDEPAKAQKVVVVEPAKMLQSAPAPAPAPIAAAVAPAAAVPPAATAVAASAGEATIDASAPQKDAEPHQGDAPKAAS